VSGVETQRRRPALPVWAIVTIAGLFALLYAYVVWTSLAFLVQQAGGVQGLSGLGWFILLLPVVFPLIAFGVAFAVGWRRKALAFVLTMLTGLCLIAVFWLDILAYAAIEPALYGA